MVGTSLGFGHIFTFMELRRGFHSHDAISATTTTTVHPTLGLLLCIPDFIMYFTAFLVITTTIQVGIGRGGDGATIY